MITIQDCLQATSLERAALFLSSKVAFDRNKGYVQSLDGQTFWEYANHMDNKIQATQKLLRRNAYQFGPCKEIIKSRSGKTRKIYISNWSDRIVERWLSTSLNILLNHTFSQSAFAYRRHSLGIDACQHQVAQVLTTHEYFIQRDITQYFYTIDHNILISKLSKLVDHDLLDLLTQRVHYQYSDGARNPTLATIGVPFGTPIACVFSNIYLTDLDKVMEKQSAKYFRYADDFLMASNNPTDALIAAELLDAGLKNLKLKPKESHSKNVSFELAPGFTKVNSVRFLGLEFKSTGGVKLPIEKQRKVINFFKRGIEAESHKINKADDRLAATVEAANKVVEKRIRSVAIIDYYLKHVDDEHQLRNMDRIIAELVISTVLQKPFRKGYFRKIPFKKLRELGLVSLVHRSRLHRHNKIHVPFLTMFNSLMLERHESAIERNRTRLQRIKMTRKLNDH